MTDNGLTCSVSRLGNAWDNAVMDNFLLPLKTKQIGRKTYSTLNRVTGVVFDYIDRFYNPTHHHSTAGYLSSLEFESQAGVA